MVEAALRDVCDDNTPFGHKVVVWAGDFRQKLPVIVDSNRDTVVEECVKTSLNHFRFVRHNLLHNVRAEQDQHDFFRWLLELGNVTLPAFRRTPYGNLKQIPEHCIANSKEELMTFCLGNLDFAFISNKAFLSPLNATCHDINDQAIRKLPGVPKTYTSVDSIDVSEQPDVDVEFLNSLTPSGFPPHRLILKVGAVVVLLRNLIFRQSLCNGTRLLIHVLALNSPNNYWLCLSATPNTVLGLCSIRTELISSPSTVTYVRIQFCNDIDMGTSSRKESGRKKVRLDRAKAYRKLHVAEEKIQVLATQIEENISQIIQKKIKVLSTILVEKRDQKGELSQYLIRHLVELLPSNVQTELLLVKV
ncbi:hypothetical protein NQ318_023625 [Aromia moschata]|uniref:ATP-dependent DNA helicase n=1 Tax=Aromia moschata TaxID=1265417 RepID=A0AAV8YRE3_9CUCU|nr:hypothetical protein NQ318_023625 [Aromia moschata]